MIWALIGELNLWFGTFGCTIWKWIDRTEWYYLLNGCDNACRVCVLFVFVKTCCYVFLVFYVNLHFFRFVRRLHVNGESWDFVLFDRALAGPSCVPVCMRVNCFTLCLFGVGRLFCGLDIPKYICVFVVWPSGERRCFVFGLAWEVEHGMCCLLLT